MIIARLITLAFISFIPSITTQSVGSAQALAVERRVHINKPGPKDSRYAYVPFDVPPHAVRINVSYQYDRANGANTIDIGLFDARSTGSDIDPHGFRGWSGGRRPEFFISRYEATPGYLPGELLAGKWSIILGLYQIVPAGVDVYIKVNIETEMNRSSNPTPTDRPGDFSTSTTATTTPRPSLRKETGWWSGDLHMHTVHSDGDWTIAELLSSARSGSLDFIVITDHNTASHHLEIDRLSKVSLSPLVLRGEEITTYGGHTNALGLPTGTWIDFRSLPGDSTRVKSIAAQVHRTGALISVNHPFALCGGCAWTYEAATGDFDAIEVWNGAWDQTDEQAVTMWDKLLQSGREITAIGSSDSHRAANPIGQPTTHVRANKLSQTALLDAIHHGRVYLSSESVRPGVRFEAAAPKAQSRVGIGDELQLRSPATIRFFVTTEGTPLDSTISLISDGQVIRRFLAKTDGPIEIQCQHDSYFRLEVRDKTNVMLALTNPIYVKIAKR